MTTAAHLRAYGYTETNESGGLVRLRSSGDPRDMWVKTDGGWEYWEWERGAWVQRVYSHDHTYHPDHGEDLVLAATPNYIWPDGYVAHVYSAAVAARNAG